MRKIAVFLLALALAFEAGGSAIALAAKAPAKPAAKTPARAAAKIPTKPTAKAPTLKKPAPKAVGTLYRGTVKEVYGDDSMFALRIGPGKLPYAVQVLATTQIVSASGEPLAFEELSPGQRVSVRGKLRSRTVIQANRITVGG